MSARGRLIDADTVKLAGIGTVRLAGIDAGRVALNALAEHQRAGGRNRRRNPGQARQVRPHRRHGLPRPRPRPRPRRRLLVAGAGRVRRRRVRSARLQPRGTPCTARGGRTVGRDMGAPARLARPQEGCRGAFEQESTSPARDGHPRDPRRPRAPVPVVGGRQWVGRILRTSAGVRTVRQCGNRPAAASLQRRISEVLDWRGSTFPRPGPHRSCVWGAGGQEQIRPSSAAGRHRPTMLRQRSTPPPVSPQARRHRPRGVSRVAMVSMAAL